MALLMSMSTHNIFFCGEMKRKYLCFLAEKKKKNYLFRAMGGTTGMTILKTGHFLWDT